MAKETYEKGKKKKDPESEVILLFVIFFGKVMTNHSSADKKLNILVDNHNPKAI
jgi:hypothetical protein